MVMQLPERDKLSMSYEQMTSRLAVLMGGRVAEEIIFGKEKVTSGAQSDIEQATKLARAMVTRWGFSDELGTVMYGENQEEVFLGYSMGRQQNISEVDLAEDRLRGAPAGRDRARRRDARSSRPSATISKRWPRACSNTRRLTGDEIIGLLQGPAAGPRDTATSRRRRAPPPVPNVGKGRPKPGPELEPQPST